MTNGQVTGHSFLTGMYRDPYFPNHLVDKATEILTQLCQRIEAEQPQDLPALYALTNDATDKFNDLATEFEDADSEIETVAREQIGAEFGFIAAAYGFTDADSEELIANRDW